MNHKDVHRVANVICLHWVEAEVGAEENGVSRANKAFKRGQAPCQSWHDCKGHGLRGDNNCMFQNIENNGKNTGFFIEQTF